MNGDGKYGFVPSFAQGSESVVQVAVFDLATTPHRPLGSVEVTVGGDPVKSETSPAFSIRVLDRHAVIRKAGMVRREKKPPRTKLDAGHTPTARLRTQLAVHQQPAEALLAEPFRTQVCRRPRRSSTRRSAGRTSGVE